MENIAGTEARKYKESWGGEYGANKDAQSGIRMGDSALNRGGWLPLGLGLAGLSRGCWLKDTSRSNHK